MEDVGKLLRSRVSLKACLPIVDVGAGRPDPDGDRRPGGGYLDLDNATPFGVYSHLNLYAAAGRAAALAGLTVFLRKRAIQSSSSPREEVTGCRQRSGRLVGFRLETPNARRGSLMRALKPRNVVDCSEEADIPDIPYD